MTRHMKKCLDGYITLVKPLAVFIIWMKSVSEELEQSNNNNFTSYLAEYRL